MGHSSVLSGTIASHAGAGTTCSSRGRIPPNTLFASHIIHHVVLARTWGSCHRQHGVSGPPPPKALNSGTEEPAPGSGLLDLSEPSAQRRVQLPAAARPSTPTPRYVWRVALRALSNLRLAIAELAVIAGLSACGTLVDQGQSPAYYVEHYPLGQVWLPWPIILPLQLDHIYSAPYFLGLLGLLGASLTACTTTTQWPQARVAQRWRFKPGVEALRALPAVTEMEGHSVRSVGQLLRDRGYQVFVEGARQAGAAGGAPTASGPPSSEPRALYAFKGLAGKLGPIGVHASMLAVLAGVSLGAVGRWEGVVMMPEGAASPVRELLHPASPFAWEAAAHAADLKFDAFQIDYRDDGSIRQFLTSITVLEEGVPVARQTVSVNQPLRYKGLTAYQTDWALAAVRVSALPLSDAALGPQTGTALSRTPPDEAGVSEGQGKPVPNTPRQPVQLSLPMAQLAGESPESKLFGTFLPLSTLGLPAEDGAPGSNPRGISLLARDLQTVVLYDGKGAFVGVRRPGSNLPITVEGVELRIGAITPSSGMQLKIDPGVPLVYAGFLGLCITVVVSYLSHSQLWGVATEDGSVLLGGRTNRALQAFADEVVALGGKQEEEDPEVAAGEQDRSSSWY
ncbi:CCS1 [Auxenochlorella protothecoides x Auxenochlorella symbiontica]